MLVLSRKVNERIQIGKDIIVTLNLVAGNRATLGIEAPDDVKILRGEIVEMLAKAEQGDGIRPLRICGDRTTPTDDPAGASPGT